jgi:hypothetical protein
MSGLSMPATREVKVEDEAAIGIIVVVDDVWHSRRWTSRPGQSVVAAVVRVRLGGAVEVGRGAGDRLAPEPEHLFKYADSWGILQVGVAENLVVAGVDGVKMHAVEDENGKRPVLP